MSHTPGPWEVRFREGQSHASINAPKDLWYSLASVVVRMSGAPNDRADGVANARLIAAAPELLEVAQTLLASVAVEHHADSTGHAQTIRTKYGPLLDALSKARAAVAKFEGRSTVHAESASEADRG